MWKKYGCNKLNLKYKFDKKSNNILYGIGENKTIYKLLKFILTTIGLGAGGAAVIAQGGFLLYNLFSIPEEGKSKTHRRNLKIYDIFVSMSKLAAAGSFNLLELDKKIKTINPKTNFIKDILSVKLENNDFDSFEDQVSRIFSNETAEYVAEDFVSLFCSISDLLNDRFGTRKNIIQQTSLLSHKLSPYRKKGELKAYKDHFDSYKKTTQVLSQTQFIKYKDMHDRYMNAPNKVSKDKLLDKNPLYALYGHKDTKFYVPNDPLDKDDLENPNYRIIVPMEMNRHVQKSAIPEDLLNKIRISQQVYADDNVHRAYGQIYDSMNIQGSKVDIENKWKAYEVHMRQHSRVNNLVINPKLMKLRDDDLSQEKARSIKMALMTSIGDISELKFRPHEMDNAKISIVSGHYNSLTDIIKENPIPGAQNDYGLSPTEFRKIKRYYKHLHNIKNNDKQLDFLKEKENDLKSQRASLKNELASLGQNPIGPRPNQIDQETDNIDRELRTIYTDKWNIVNIQKGIRERLDNLKRTGGIKFNEYVMNGNLIRNIHHGGYDRNKVNDPKGLNLLGDYYDAIVKHHDTIKNRDPNVEIMKNQVHKNMQYHKHIESVYKNHYEQKEQDMFKNVEVALALGSMWAFYPVLKLSMKILPKQLSRILFDSTKVSRLFDELIGVYAGLILGSSYLVKESNAIDEKESIIKYAKTIQDLNTISSTDPLMDDIVSDVMDKLNKDSEFYSRYKPPKIDKGEINIMIDRSDVVNREEQYNELMGQYEKMKEREERFAQKRRGGLFTPKRSSDMKNRKSDDKPTSKDKRSNNRPVGVSIKRPNKKRIMNLIIENEHLNNKKLEKVKDPFVKGSYVGMMANNICSVTVEDKIKKRMHRLLCNISIRSRELGMLVSQSITLSLAFSYILQKLSSITMAHYMNYTRNATDITKIKDLCDFVSPKSRVAFKKRSSKIIYPSEVGRRF